MSIDTNEINTEEVVAAEAPISTERFSYFSPLTDLQLESAQIM